jgi:Fe2+ or Zn2+ uptake regulation protein
MMNEEDFKVMVAACKECGKEFEMRIPMPIYETMVAACEEDGETPVFVGRCPDCQERDPFLKLLKSTRITTLGSLSRRIER